MFVLTNDQYQTQAVHHQRTDLHLKCVTYCHETVTRLTCQRYQDMNTSPSYNEFGYNERPAITSNLSSQKRTLLIDISVKKVQLQ